MLSFKNALILFLLFSFSTFSAQRKMKDFSRILHSKNIYEIDAFLRDSHPDEPKRLILKPRLIKMLKEYIQNAHPEDQRVKDFQEKIALLRRKSSTKIEFEEMNDLIRQKQIAKFEEELKNKEGSTITFDSNASPHSPNENAQQNTPAMGDLEAEEFNMLMNVNPMEHKNNTVKILNSLFDNDPMSKESIVLVENKSTCNIIMRFEGVGNTKLRLAIPAKAQNTIVVPKGDYLFASIVCGAQYASQKTVQKAIMVALDNPPTSNN